MKKLCIAWSCTLKALSVQLVLKHLYYPPQVVPSKVFLEFTEHVLFCNENDLLTIDLCCAIRSFIDLDEVKLLTSSLGYDWLRDSALDV